MNTILELRKYLDDAIETYGCLRENNNALNSPAFSCRHAFPKTLEDPQSKKDIGSILSQKEQKEQGRKIESLFNRVERLKTGVDTISVLQDLGLRDGRSDTDFAPAISEMDVLLQETIEFKTNLSESVMFEEDAERDLSEIFEMAALRLANARMGIERPDVMEGSRDDLEFNLDNNRLVYGALCVEHLVLQLGQVSANQSVLLQLERAVQKKLIPDEDEIRNCLQNYRVASGRLLTDVAKGIGVMEQYVAGYGGAGMSVYPFKSIKFGFLSARPGQSLTL